MKPRLTFATKRILILAVIELILKEITIHDKPGCCSVHLCVAKASQRLGGYPVDTKTKET